MAEKRTKRPTKATKELAESIEGLEAELVSGLPSAEVLAKYEKIVPGGAARLLEVAMLREQQERELEKRALDAELRLEKFKQISRVMLALVAGVFGGMLLVRGSELAGLIIVLAAVAALVGMVKFEEK